MNTIKILGSPLYQWEIGRKIQIMPFRDLRVSAVHFSHLGDAEAQVVKPKNENDIIMADIPNILLQDGRNLVVYVVDVSEDCVETLRECVFPVRPRPRPADYAYTETEVLNYSYLDKRLNNLEGEGLPKAVSDYLKDNPVQAGATAEEAKQIEQNKQDIETLSREKLSADALPGAVNDALAQAKESGEFKGEPGDDYVLTEADKTEIAEMAAELVEVPENGGGTAELKLLQSVDITGVGTVTATPDKPVRNVMVIVKGAKNVSGGSSMRVKINSRITAVSFALGKDGSGEKWGYAVFKFNGVMWECYKAPEASNGTAEGIQNATMPYYNPNLFSGEAEAIQVFIGSTAADYLPTGGTIEIYGG